MVVFVVKRYAVRKPEIRPYAVRKLKMKQYPVRKGGEVSPLMLSVSYLKRYE